MSQENIIPENFNISGVPNDTRSLLEQEQELLNEGFPEDDLGRLYPNVVGNGHPSVCLCPQCAPDEHEDHDEHEPTIVFQKGILTMAGAMRLNVPHLANEIVDYEDLGSGNAGEIFHRGERLGCNLHGGIVPLIPESILDDGEEPAF